ncbi:MAG: hypothetical protein GWP17_00515 [Aquificales bacterium]|nr:hypothetical protein [Aquificales bacterium]
MPTVAPAAAVGSATPIIQTELTEKQTPSSQPSAFAPVTTTATIQPVSEATKPVLPTETAVPPEPTSSATPALTATPSITPSITPEPTATYWPTVTRQMLSAAQTDGLVPCTQRLVADGLLTIATQQFTLPATYVPANLVPLSDYFADDVVRGLDLYVRAAIIEPLQQMVEAMHEAGLRPSILSAYRSYNEQAMAWKWWESQYPGRVAIMSARPGNSEHQLGTTVDFGSPELNHLFHVDFAGTAEGVWLVENAHRFGFTLSYPADAYAVTGFKYEPWHFRYVGLELAEQLAGSGQILTEWQLANLPHPCIP